MYKTYQNQKKKTIRTLHYLREFFIQRKPKARADCHATIYRMSFASVCLFHRTARNPQAISATNLVPKNQKVQSKLKHRQSNKHKNYGNSGQKYVTKGNLSLCVSFQAY